MQIQKVIERLGYTPNEAKVYLAALSLCECHISDVAAKTKLPRTSAQAAVDKLHEDGLMDFYIHRRYKYWVAANPERLLTRLREREEAVRLAMPELAALRRTSDGKPSVNVFLGVEEIKLIYDDMLATKQPILGIVPWEDWIRLVGMEFMTDFIASRGRHFLHIRPITPKTPVTIALKSRDAKELRDTRYAPHDARINTTTFIYGKKVAIVSLNKQLPTAVVIDDADIRDTLSVFFEELWERSG